MKAEGHELAVAVQITIVFFADPTTPCVASADKISTVGFSGFFQDFIRLRVATAGQVVFPGLPDYALRGYDRQDYRAPVVASMCRALFSGFA